MKKRKIYLPLKDGTLLYYEISGQGRPVVFIHGNNQSGKIFMLVIKKMEKYFQCINIDCRAQGKSNNRSSKLSFQMMSDDIVAVLDKEKIDKADVIGFSDGANVAMFLGRDHGNRVNKLILNAGNVLHSGVEKYYHLIDKTYYLLAKIFHFREQVVALMLRDSGLKMEELKQISNESLVLVGQFDMIKRSHSVAIANLIPKGKLEVIPYAFHLYCMYNPWGFTKRCMQFLLKK